MANVQLIRYVSDQPVSMAIGNKDCYVKPSIQLVYDTDGASGHYGNIMSLIPPNVNMTYINVFLKYNSNFDYVTGGEVTLNDIPLMSGDKVWLSQQNDTLENGIYIVKENTWEYLMPVSSNVFVDLGARAYDQVDGDLSRDIIVDQNIKFGEVGFYSITYYVLNSLGILSKTIRKLKILSTGASIVPTDSYKITDYQIISDANSELLLNGQFSTCDSNNCNEGNSNSTIYIRKDGSITFTNDQSIGGHRLTALADPISDTDAVNLRTLINSLTSISNTTSTAHITGENINTHQFVYKKDDGKVYGASSNDINLMNKIIGIVITGNDINKTVNVVSSGLLGGFTSLSTGDAYFINSGGYASNIIPTTGFTQFIGVASSPTEILINMQIPIGI